MKKLPRRNRRFGSGVPMGKYSRWVDIQTTPKTKNNWRLANEELDERFEALQRIIPYLTAKHGLKKLLSGIPGGSDYKDLRKSLRISEIPMGKKGGAYSIHVPVKGRRIRKVDVAKTVIYVRAKKKLTRPDPAIKILEDRGPWTADTLPFWPNKKEALVVQRKVTKKEADRVAKEQKNKLPRILTELKEAGRTIKKPKAGESGHVKRKGKAVPDVAMQALGLEFGGTGKKSRPVFRRMIRFILLLMRRLAKKEPVIKQVLTDANSKKYNQYPPRVGRVSMGEAKKFIGFQKRLGR